MMEDGQAQLIERFWHSFLATLPSPQERESAKYQAWAFGNTPELADRLGELVRRGVKTATAALEWVFDEGKEPRPAVGDYSIILDGRGQPLCIIQTTELRSVPFSEVDPEHAFLEGEGDRSLAYWAEAHWSYFKEECRSLGRTPDERMPIVCERFRLVYK
jgi:uncharacterized protein YhfF